MPRLCTSGHSEGVEKTLGGQIFKTYPPVPVILWRMLEICWKSWGGWKKRGFTLLAQPMVLRYSMAFRVSVTSGWFQSFGMLS